MYVHMNTCCGHARLILQLQLAGIPSESEGLDTKLKYFLYSCRRFTPRSLVLTGFTLQIVNVRPQGQD